MPETSKPVFIFSLLVISILGYAVGFLIPALGSWSSPLPGLVSQSPPWPGILDSPSTEGEFLIKNAAERVKLQFPAQCIPVSVY
jgi:hypothetical protein